MKLSEDAPNEEPQEPMVPLSESERAEVARNIEQQMDIARAKLNKIPRHALIETVLNLMVVKYTLEQQLLDVKKGIKSEENSTNTDSSVGSASSEQV